LLFQSSLGIEIREGGVSIAYLKASFKGVKLVAHAEHPLDRETVADDLTAIVAEVVNRFIKDNKIVNADIYLGIPRDKAVLRYIELPLVVKEELRSTLQYEMEKYVPISGDDLYFDYQVIAEDRENKKLHLLVIAAKKSVSQPYVDLAKKLDLGVSGLEINTTSLANYLSYDRADRNHAPYAIAYMDGEGHLEVNLIKKNLLVYSRAVQVGEEIEEFILEQLNRSRKVLKEDPGRLKVIFCGAGANNDLLQSLAAEESYHIQPVDSQGTAVPYPSLMSAFGLALKGLQKVPLPINLLPPESRRKPRKGGLIAMLILSALVVLLSLGWGGSLVLHDRLTLDRLNSELSGLEAEVAGIERSRKRCEEIEGKISYFQEHYRGRVPLLQILKDISERVPATVWIRDFTFSEDRNSIVLKGYAKGASDLIPLLEESPLFSDVVFLSTIVKEKDGTESFQVGLKVNQPNVSPRSNP
jgi:general secretion pathway protein L